MTNIVSKVLQNKCPHAGPCIPETFSRIDKYYISNAKYYAPVFFLAILTKINQLSPEVVKKAFSYYLQCTTGGFAIGWTVSTFICFCRYLLGKHTYYTFVYVPSLIGALNVFWCSPRVQNLYLVTVFQCTVESYLIRRNNVFKRMICDSALLQTLIFMSSSALILHAKQTGDFKGFWLLKPNKILIKNEAKDFINTEIVDTETKICTHEEKSCNRFLIKGLKSYMALGLVHDVVKALLHNAPTGVNGFLPKLFQKLSNLKLESTIVLASYVGIYRFTNCFLNRKANDNLQRNHHIASFLSGICYLYTPNLTLLSYCIISNIEILYNMLTKYKGDEKNMKSKILEILKRIPLARIIFPFCLAHLVHNCSIYDKSVSHLSAVIVNSHTNHYPAHMLTYFQKYRKGLTSLK